MRERSPHYIADGRKVEVLYHIQPMEQSRMWTLCSCDTPENAEKMAKSLNEALERMIKNESL